MLGKSIQEQVGDRNPGDLVKTHSFLGKIKAKPVKAWDGSVLKALMWWWEREWSIPEKPCSWSQHMTKRAAVSAQEAPVLILFWLRAEPENLSQRCSHGGRQRGAAAQLGCLDGSEAGTARRPGPLRGQVAAALAFRPHSSWELTGTRNL